MNHSAGFAGRHAPKQGLRDRHSEGGLGGLEEGGPATCPTLRLSLSSLIKDVSRAAGAIHKKSCWMVASQSGQPGLNLPCQVRLAGSTNKDPLSPHTHAMTSWSQKELPESEDTEVMSYERTAEWNRANFNKATTEIC